MQKTKVLFVLNEPVEKLFSRYCFAKGFTKSGLLRTMLFDYIHNNREEFMKYADSEVDMGLYI